MSEEFYEKIMYEEKRWLYSYIYTAGNIKISNILVTILFQKLSIVFIFYFFWWINSQWRVIEGQVEYLLKRTLMLFCDLQFFLQILHFNVVGKILKEILAKILFLFLLCFVLGRQQNLLSNWVCICCRFI